MFENHRQKAALLFAAADVILTVLAFEAAYQTRLLLPLPRTFFITTPVKALLLGFILVLWLVLGRMIGAYARLYGADTRAAIYDTLRQVLFGGLGIAMFLFVLRMDLSRPFLGLFLLYNLVLLILYRAAAGRLRGYVRRQFGAEVHCVVVGEGPQARRLAARLEAAGEVGLRLEAFLDLVEPESLARLTAMLREHVVDEVFFVVDAARLGDLEEIFLLCDEEGVRTRVATHFFPHVNSRVYFDRLGDLPLLSFSATPHDEVRLFIKRTFDVVCSLAALLVLAIPMAVVAIAVRLSSAGPALFVQIRCGLNGRRFRFYKFRSMVADAESQRADLEHLNEKDGPAFKIAEDPRVTPIGRFLRRYSIDEWPQFWNVLRGDMSLVGPRPVPDDEAERYGADLATVLSVRPGMTGMWQVGGRHQVSYEERIALDVRYVESRNVRTTIRLLVRTVVLIATRRNGAS